MSQADASKPALQVTDLSFSNANAISFAIKPGETVCLTGPSGAGKSRLLRALADLDPHSGQIYLKGNAQQKVPPSIWRQSVALLPAEAAWWEERVEPHFAPFLPENNMLASVGLDNAILERRVSLLSTGERQRLAILRLLVRQPQVLLLDEPTAHLDADSVLRVEALLDTYQQTSAAAILWVSHSEVQQKRVADRVLRLHDGVLKHD